MERTFAGAAKLFFFFFHTSLRTVQCVISGGPSGDINLGVSEVPPVGRSST